MLIPLKPLLEKYSLKINGCVHVGAHFGQEYTEYKLCGIEKILFIEPCKQAVEMLVSKFKHYMDVGIVPLACGAHEGFMAMNIERDNQGQSNSLLKPKLHLQQHPNVRFLGETEIVEVKKLDTILYGEIDYNLLAIDVQGYEGEVLKGATETLKGIDLVYTECNSDFTYENNMLVEEMDLLLKGFTRVETCWASKNLTWGDCVFIKNNLLERVV